MKTNLKKRHLFRSRAIKTVYVYVEASQVLTNNGNTPIEINWVPVTN